MLSLAISFLLLLVILLVIPHTDTETAVGVQSAKEKKEGSQKFLEKRTAEETRNRKTNRDLQESLSDLNSVRIVGPFVDLTTAEIAYSSKIYQDQENTVIVKLNSSVEGAVIYMNVTDQCNFNLHYQCVKTDPNNPYLNEDIVVLLDDRGNGTYEGAYTIKDIREGTISLSFYAISNGLHEVCYDSTELEEPPLYQQINSEIDFNWDDNNVCNKLKKYVSIRWTGKLLIEVNKYFFCNLTTMLDCL
eukprot:TRINITY_DN6838_c0_g1_i4.p1 TRINITY_DN6838_c0_g1~~TRINITY_DN6838_c0_g1_i4.p1  ORF type:complete len:257 (-),score=9.26 TRINITY_DN6838_c0_g1_i4:114-851(-)